ncbi:FAST kinase domain-containing protein 4 isoform X2 [Pleurodeles waltl]|uniref:FAST kinase domain-containing protein 4 isoform X2 n=1 Tax=Pleurodeles waltl TaxID=8319 RepID=UPI003709944D
MAARLAHRCSRLLGASLQVQIAAPTCALTSRPSPLKTLPLSAVHTSSFCQHADSFQVKEQVYTKLPDRTEVEGLIETASSLDDLLQIGRAQIMTGNQAALILIAISRNATETKVEAGSILQDDRCQHLLQIIEKQISHVWNGNLVNLLKSLYLLGLDDGKLLRSVENEVRWRLRRLSFKQLVGLADFCVPFAHTPEQKSLVSDLVKHLELRWTEIDDPKSVVILMTKVGYISHSLMEKLEDKALEYAEHFTPEETRKVLLALAAQKRRSVSLLRALSYHLVQRHFGLSTGVLLDVAFAFGKLNFHQAQLLQKMASDMLPKVSEMTPSEVTRCVKSMAYLKWLSLPLFEAFTEVHERLPAEMDALDPQFQVDLVWSLCVLQQAKDLYLQRVLRPDFYMQILGDQSAKTRNYRLKVVCINSSARFDGSDYQGPYIPSDVLHTEVSLHGHRKPTPLQTGLVEALKAIAGESCFRHGVITVHGWQIDGEVVLDTENNPLPLNELVAPHLPKSPGANPLPTGAKRLAFLCWDFSSFSGKSKDLLGRYAVCRRHLQAAGFLIVDVPYYEWFDLKSEWQKVAYLKDKMGKAVAEDLAK